LTKIGTEYIEQQVNKTLLNFNTGLTILNQDHHSYIQL
jgi:hypothetical protein